jgi:oligopeptide/dipeptide ABC transporter ATP-binding protein
MTGEHLLAVEDLTVEFRVGRTLVPVVRGLDISLTPGASLGLVGESGCGKSVTALALLGLLPASARVTGRVIWRGLDLLALPEVERRRYRGRAMSLVFQEPAAALNPVLTVGEQVAEVLRHHHGLEGAAAWRRALDLLSEVRLPDPEIRARHYPHQLSGGMQQRVMIAATLACDPELLVADEPTTALDVTVQAQILQLLVRLRRERGMALLFITHDLALVPSLVDRVAVLYAGRLVEYGPAAAVLQAPAHPYTRGLVRTLPELWPPHRELPDLPGQPPDPRRPAAGCPFAPRCTEARAGCHQTFPQRIPVGAKRWAACLADVATRLAAEEVLP